MTDDGFGLINLQPFDGEFVAYGNDTIGGYITGRGTVSNGKVNLHKVHYVQELHHNLLRVSQLCDKKT